MENRAADREAGNKGNVQDLLQKEKRRRPFIFWLSFLFLFAAGGLIALLLWYSGLISQKTQHQPQIEIISSNGDTITMQNIRISGLDDENLPFTLIAQISKWKEKEKKLINLQSVKGTLSKRNGEIIRFSANRAIYNIKTHTATLMDDVQISSQGRYDLITQKAIINITTKTFHVPEALRVILKDGEIRAGNMRTERNTDHIFFGGGVYATFRNEEPPEKESTRGQ